MWFLVVFLVLFPKAGVKISGIPFTWGYVFLGLTLPVLAVIRILQYQFRLTRITLIAIASLIPFQALGIYDLATYGASGVGNSSSFLVTFYALPFAFLIVYPAFLPLVDGARLARWLRFCIFAAAVFGIILFVTYPFTKQVFQIPYLTVNADDYGDIVATKHIDRGLFLKLISTYNNGNLYGAATLILLPIYGQLERRGWRRLIVRLALILTLSRTIWLGLAVEQTMLFLRMLAASASDFPRIVAGPALRRFLPLAATVIAILGGSIIAQGNLAFLLDSKLGGRSDYFSEALQHIHFLPDRIYIGFQEVVYTTALETFGVAGLLSIGLIYGGPIVLMLVNRRRILQSPLRVAAFEGLVLYAIISAADGAVMLIPVMAFYWFAYMIFLEGWPGGETAIAAATPSARRGFRFAPLRPSLALDSRFASNRSR